MQGKLEKMLQNKQRFAIICETRGLFLGTYGEMIVFANLDDLGAYKAPTFPTKKNANNYANKFLNPDGKKFSYIFPKVDVDNDYVSCIDMIKCGYGEFTGHMISNLPNASATLH